MKKINALPVALALLTGACSTLQPHLPSITEEPTSQRLPGKIIWHDLITHRPDECKRFYGELFGWEFEDLGLDFGSGHTLNYTLIRHRGELIAGMVDARRLHRDNPEQLSQWVVVMSVADADAAVASVRAAGGKVMTPPTDLAERGRLALIEDPRGATLALLETRDGDPRDQQTPLGGFLWDEVWTDDVQAAIAFYSSLADLEPRTRSLAVGRQYDYLASGNTPRAGVLRNPVADLEPTWVSYVRVENPVAVTARVASLGGTVLAEAQARDLGGQVALIADPSGAGIAIQTWPPDAASREEE